MRLWQRVVSLGILGSFVGCSGSKTPPTPLKPLVPASVLRGETPTRVFSAEEEVPTTAFAFQGSKGSIRVTMEIEGTSSSTSAMPPSINDVLFQAVGEGRLLVSFKRPWPEHPNGQVTIRCESGQELSTANFEPELWFHLPGAIITFEPPPAEPSSVVVEGKEVILGRYVARNIPRDLRLTFKAVFTRNPMAPRTKAGLKPPR